MIEVEEYVRTNNGLLGRVNKIELKGNGIRYAGEFITDTIIQFNDGKVYERRVKDKDIVNHSKNLIDLIEVGDIIEINKGKYEVIYDKSLEQLGVLIPNRDCLEIRHSSLEHIFTKYEDITILTKEQYQANCYTVERKEE